MKKSLLLITAHHHPPKTSNDRYGGLLIFFFQGWGSKYREITAPIPSYIVIGSGLEKKEKRKTSLKAINRKYY